MWWRRVAKRVSRPSLIPVAFTRSQSLRSRSLFRGLPKSGDLLEKARPVTTLDVSAEVQEHSETKAPPSLLEYLLGVITDPLFAQHPTLRKIPRKDIPALSVRFVGSLDSQRLGLVEPYCYAGDPKQQAAIEEDLALRLVRFYSQGNETNSEKFKQDSYEEGNIDELFAKMLEDSRVSRLLMQFSRPELWYPLARKMRRRLIIHSGPTNSGKTYSAMSRLKDAQSGVYCGPLRLLAWEIQEKLVENGVPCNLQTGQEKVEISDAFHTSSTIEMLDYTKSVDVGIIDEMQMMGSRDRGSHWTRALLGMPAREVHVCGDPTMVPLVKRIAHELGEDVEHIEYERLTSLTVSNPLNSYVDIQPGDCLVAFGRKTLYRAKKMIEEVGNKCCIVYGSLPPEVRKQQAQLFNDQDNDYNVLVATDAIGMGLNLNIRRVIFHATEKFDGEQMRPLYTGEVLQIAGRAGRFGTNYPNGFVSLFLENQDQCHTDKSTLLQDAMNTKMEPIRQAGLAPTIDQVLALQAISPNIRLSVIVEFLSEFNQLREEMFFRCDISNQVHIIEMLEDLGLPTDILYTFSLCPVDTRCETQMDVLYTIADYMREENILIEDVIPELKQRKKKDFSLKIAAAETIYDCLGIYAWLGLRYSNFPEVDDAIEEQKAVAEFIEEDLDTLTSHNFTARRKAKSFGSRIRVRPRSRKKAKRYNR